MKLLLKRNGIRLLFAVKDFTTLLKDDEHICRY